MGKHAMNYTKFRFVEVEGNKVVTADKSINRLFKKENEEQFLIGSKLNDSFPG